MFTSYNPIPPSVSTRQETSHSHYNDAMTDPKNGNEWASWRYGSMTPPEGKWYTRIIPESTRRLKRMIPESIRQIERVRRSRLWDTKSDEPKEKPPWRYGPMSPQENWYERIPDTVKRTKTWIDEVETNTPKADEPERGEMKERHFFDLDGNVDSGHCAESGDWTEEGACMCTVTWTMPGRFPRPFCETVCNGVIDRTYVEQSTVPTEETYDPGEPCWDVKPVPEDPQTRLCWVKQYNPQARRHEYVSKPWRPPITVEGAQEEHSAGFEHPERLEPQDEFINLSSNPEVLKEPYTCSRKPPWLQHVHKFVRAEELASPPPPASAFVNKSGTLLGEFSEEFFKVPYYDPECREFRYAEPRTMDMKNLKLKFTSSAPPPKPVPPQRPKPLPKRPLVMAQKKEQTTLRIPEYNPRLVYEPPPVRVLVRPQPRPSPKLPVENWFHRLRVVSFPASPRPSYDDTPCPPPRKFKPKAEPKRRRVRFKDEYEEYRPDENDESYEVADKLSYLTKTAGVPKNKIKRRRAKNSDPTYRQHGVRENNRIEKKDLLQMYSEETGDGDDMEPDEGRPVSQSTKPKLDFKPKSILKKGGRKKAEPAISKSKWHDIEVFPSKTSKPIGPVREAPRDATPHPKATRKMGRSQDGEYVAFRDREEEMRERFDIRDMKRQVDDQAEKESDQEPEIGGHDDELSMLANTSRKTPRRRKAPEDRAYRPGRRL